MVASGRSGRSSALTVLAVVGALVLGACDADRDDAGDRGDAGSGEGGTDASASGWPVDAPPTDAEVVDADLVARILVEFDVHLRDIHRAVAADGAVGELPQALIRSVYTDAAEPDVTRRLEDHLDDVRDDAGVPRSAVVEVGSVGVDPGTDAVCVDALVRRDLAPVLDVADGVGTWSVTLVVVDDSDNGTTWRMARDTPGEQPPAGCDRAG